MNTYRFTFKTRCGHTNVVVENGDFRMEAEDKVLKHIENKHTPMVLQKAEVKNGDRWFRV